MANSAFQVVRIGAEAPGFELDSTLGRRLSLDEFKGQSNLVLVFLRGLGCPNCIQELFQLKEDEEMLRQANAEVLVIAPHSVPRLVRHLESYGLDSFLGVADPKRHVFAAYQVREGESSSDQRPALFVLDKSGIVRYAHLGQLSDCPSSEEILRDLEKPSK